MFEPLVVEVWGKPAGVVLKEGKTFTFHAFARPFSELDGTEFNTQGVPLAVFKGHIVAKRVLVDD